MLAVKRVKLPASDWLNRQDKPLPRRGMFPVNGTLLGRFSVRIKGTVKANKLVYNN